MRWRPTGRGWAVGGCKEVGDIQSSESTIRLVLWPFRAGWITRAFLAPGADMYETKEDLVIKVDLPGMDEGCAGLHHRRPPESQGHGWNRKRP
jgi:hypothetical protein